MNISGATVLVTGANRGIGAEFVRQLRDRGAATVYAGARDPKSLTAQDGVQALALDVTNAAQVRSAAAQASDVDLLINNAGVSAYENLIDGDLTSIRAELEANLFGPLLLSRAFAPVLAANGGGAIVNALSALSWISFPGSSSYSVSKAAAWSLTDGLRNELAAQGTQVLALHMGAVDTDMMQGYEGSKLSPAEVVSAALGGLEAGAVEVLVDETARQAKASLTLDPGARYAAFVAALS